MSNERTRSSTRGIEAKTSRTNSAIAGFCAKRSGRERNRREKGLRKLAEGIQRRIPVLMFTFEKAFSEAESLSSHVGVN